MDDDLLYSEKLSSPGTELLFLALTLLCGALAAGWIAAAGVDLLAGIFLALCVLFLFYSINYRTLDIQLTAQSLRLSFGIFAWTIALEHIGGIQPDDDLPALVKYGGAGIHFMLFRGRYRASFNFLEHPRVVIGLKHKAGLVQDVSFSTGRPEELIRSVRAAIGGAESA
jgi:hypothetical protein